MRPLLLHPAIPGACPPPPLHSSAIDGDDIRTATAIPIASILMKSFLLLSVILLSQSLCNIVNNNKLRLRRRFFFQAEDGIRDHDRKEGGGLDNRDQARIDDLRRG